MPCATVSASVSAVALLAMAMASCAAAPGAPRAASEGVEAHGATATPSSSPAEASVAPAEPDAGIEGGASLAPWPKADTCTFPPVAPSEGTTAKQCCHPAPSVTLCLETASLIHHHTVGPYTERTLTVTHDANAQAPSSFPLDRQSHGSMARPDVVFARLLYRVHQTGLELRVRSGCKNVCATERCGAEEKLLARICTSVGTYGWDGEHLVRD